jgi:predicted MFS family arabinose efflux permease
MPARSSFRHLAVANLAAQSAEQLGGAATPIVAVLLLQAGAAEVGWVAAAQTLPFLLLALPLGLIADRYPRRRVLIGAEALRVVAFAALALLIVADGLSLVALAALGALGAVGTVAFSIAAPALVPALVPAHELPGANARLELARSLACTAGPALGGALVAAFGGGAVFASATVLALLALGAVWRLVEPGHDAAAAAPGVAGVAVADAGAPAGLRTALLEALRFVWRHRSLRPVLLTALVWNLAWFVLQAALVPHAMRSLGLDAQGVGAMLGAFGAGALLGAAMAPRIVKRLGLVRALLVGPLLSVLAAATMVATLAWPHAAWAMASMAVFGFGPTVWVVTSTTLRQSLTPPNQLARVGAVFLTVNAGARPLGAALAAVVATALLAQGCAPAVGEATCLVLALLGFVAQAALIARHPMLRPAGSGSGFDHR